MRTLSALWQLARPGMLPLVWLLPCLGYGWAQWDGGQAQQRPQALALVLAAWTCLHAGALWLNALLDHDERPVLFGRPVSVPDGTALAAHGALLCTLLLAGWASLDALLPASAAVFLAILYSHPATAWKGRPLAGPLVNAVGYGLLSPWAGFAVAGIEASTRTLLLWPLLAVGLLAPTFAAQAFQGEQDAARGYRTLVVTHGPVACVRAARAALLIALAWGLGLAAVGLVPRLCLLGAVPWLAVERWLARPGSVDARRAQGLVLRMAVATVLTVGLAVVDGVAHYSFR